MLSLTSRKFHIWAPNFLVYQVDEAIYWQDLQDQFARNTHLVSIYSQVWMPILLDNAIWHPVLEDKLLYGAFMFWANFACH